MINFCTLFDSNYLSRGIAMYESLKKHCDDFHLYIFAFDDKCYEILNRLNLSNVSIITLKEFEDKELLRIKKTRTYGEYCWTCTPSVILYCLKKYKLDICTYIDADLYFFSSPEVLLDELGNNSVIITEHRYTKKYDQTKTSGKYCVQFVTCKNNKNGLIVLNWWRKACIQWCYARVEDGKFGDQKYLDDWTSKFQGVHELINLGGGVAPWNIQQYRIIGQNNKLYGINKKTKENFRLIFYHFHGIKFFKNDIVFLSGYNLDKKVIKIIYSPYIKHLENTRKDINKIDGSFCPHGELEETEKEPISTSMLIRTYFYDIKKNLKNLIKSLFFIDLIRLKKTHNYFNKLNF